MTNSLTLLLMLSIVVIYTSSYYEISKMQEYKECHKIMDKTIECINEAYYSGECETKIRGGVEIKRNFLFCSDLYYKIDGINLSDAMITADRISCERDGDEVRCKAI